MLEFQKFQKKTDKLLYKQKRPLQFFKHVKEFKKRFIFSSRIQNVTIKKVRLSKQQKWVQQNQFKLPRSLRLKIRQNKKNYLESQKRAEQGKSELKPIHKERNEQKIKIIMSYKLNQNRMNYHQLRNPKKYVHPHSFQEDNKYDLEEYKTQRRQSCTNDFFGGINQFQRKTKNIKSPINPKILELKNRKKLNWKIDNYTKLEDVLEIKNNNSIETDQHNFMSFLNKKHVYTTKKKHLHNFFKLLAKYIHVEKKKIMRKIQKETEKKIQEVKKMIKKKELKKEMRKTFLMKKQRKIKIKIRKKKFAKQLKSMRVVHLESYKPYQNSNVEFTRKIIKKTINKMKRYMKTFDCLRNQEQQKLNLRSKSSSLTNDNPTNAVNFPQIQMKKLLSHRSQPHQLFNQTTDFQFLFSTSDKFKEQRFKKRPPQKVLTILTSSDKSDQNHQNENLIKPRMKKSIFSKQKEKQLDFIRNKIYFKTHCYQNPIVKKQGFQAKKLLFLTNQGNKRKKRKSYLR